MAFVLHVHSALVTSIVAGVQFAVVSAASGSAAAAVVDADADTPRAWESGWQVLPPPTDAPLPSDNRQSPQRTTDDVVAPNENRKARTVLRRETMRSGRGDVPVSLAVDVPGSPTGLSTGTKQEVKETRFEANFTGIAHVENSSGLGKTEPSIEDKMRDSTNPSLSSWASTNFPTNGRSNGPYSTDDGTGATDLRLGKTPSSMTASFLLPTLLCVVACEVCGAILFELLHTRCVTVDLDMPLPSIGERRRIPIWLMFDGFPGLVLPYFTSSEGSRGRACVVIVLSLGLVSLFVSYVHNAWQKEWWDLFNKNDKSHFANLMGVYIVIVIAFMFTSTYAAYTRSWLYIDWREFMTRSILRKWLGSHTHFLLQLEHSRSISDPRGADEAEALGVSSVTDDLGSRTSMLNKKRIDNPDQRIQEDVHLFVINAIDITSEFFESFGSLCVFIPIVLMLEPSSVFGTWMVPGWLLLVSCTYSILGTICTHVIGWPLVNNNFARQKLEADFRHHALHVHDNSESVALYGSEAGEQENLYSIFENIKRMQWQHMILNKRMSFFSSAYNFTQFLVPFFILAPSYFEKELTLGELFQLTGAVGNVCSGFDWFLRVYGSLTDWRATADRLLSFEAQIDEVQPQASQVASNMKFVPSPFMLDGAGLRAEVDAIRLPSGETIWTEVHIEIPRSQMVLISGPEGVGKSVLLKALAGIWPFVHGSQVQMPVQDKREVLFVPQRPALPKLCSLAEAIAYPEPRENYSDAQLLRAFHDVKLTDLFDSPDAAAPQLEVETSSADPRSETEEDEQKGMADYVKDRARAATTGASPLAAGFVAAASAAARYARGRPDSLGLGRRGSWSTIDSAGIPSCSSSEALSTNDEGASSSDAAAPSTSAMGRSYGVNALDHVDNWSLRLSPGQQQRLAIGHVLLKRPRVLFLDEATSSVGKEAAVELYAEITSRLPAGAIVVSISHDISTLEPIHNAHFTIVGDGENQGFVKVKGEGIITGQSGAHSRATRLQRSPTCRL